MMVVSRGERCSPATKRPAVCSLSTLTDHRSVRKRPEVCKLEG